MKPLLNMLLTERVKERHTEEREERRQRGNIKRMEMVKRKKKITAASLNEFSRRKGVKSVMLFVEERETITHAKTKEVCRDKGKAGRDGR